MESRAGLEKQYLNILHCQTIYHLQHFSGHLTSDDNSLTNFPSFKKNVRKALVFFLQRSTIFNFHPLWCFGLWGNKCIQTTAAAEGWIETWSTINHVPYIHCNNHLIGFMGQSWVVKEEPGFEKKLPLPRRCKKMYLLCQFLFFMALLISGLSSVLKCFVMKILHLYKCNAIQVLAVKNFSMHFTSLRIQFL